MRSALKQFSRSNSLWNTLKTILQSSETTCISKFRGLSTLFSSTSNPAAALPLPASLASSSWNFRGISTTSFASNSEEKPPSGDAGQRPPSQKSLDELAEALMQGQALIAQQRLNEAEELYEDTVKEAEQIYGMDAVQTLPFLNQLAQLMFMQDRCQNAQVPALKAYNIIKNIAATDKAPASRGSAASLAIRYATTLAGAGDYPAAAEVLETARWDIAEIVPSIAQFASSGDAATARDAQQLLMVLDIAKNEAYYYSDLCRLAQMEDPVSDDGQTCMEGMRKALTAMKMHLGDRNPVIASAIREQNRLLYAAHNSGNWRYAEWLCKLALDLWTVYDKEDKSLHTPLLYQIGTLQYCNGAYEEAIASLQQCFDLLNSGDATEEQQHHVEVQFRLAMALAAAGKHDQAREMLKDIEMADSVKQDFAMTREVDFMKALMELRELKESGSGGGEGKRREEDVLDDLSAPLRTLKNLGGEGHMVVLNAQRLYDQVTGKKE